MRVWKVQYAYGEEVGNPSVHRSEDAAKGETAHLLGNWIMKNLASHVRNLQRMNEHPEFVMDGKAVVNQVIELLNAGDVWGAYDVWQEFYDKYENELGMPLYVVIGTVIVETSQQEGPMRRGRRQLPTGGRPPKEQYQNPDRPLISAWREELEIDMVIRQLVNRLVPKLQAEGKQMRKDEFMQQMVGVLQQVSEQAEAAGEDLTVEEFTMRVETALDKHFGLSGSRRRGVPILRRFS